MQTYTLRKRKPGREYTMGDENQSSAEEERDMGVMVTKDTEALSSVHKGHSRHSARPSRQNISFQKSSHLPETIYMVRET